jgi:alpha-1,2-mannosyltransferase
MRRIRMHGFVLAAILWSVYAMDFATPGSMDRFGLIKGTDFVQFYTLGNLALSHRADLLYGVQAQSDWIKKIVPQAKDIFYAPVYGPQVSLFFKPFARLSYSHALALWLVINVLLYGLCCLLIWRTCPSLKNYPGTTIILAVAFPGFFHLVTFGQTSGIALFCFTLAYLAFRKDYRFLAGLAIGMLIFKPQFGIVAALVFIFANEWRVVIGAICGAFVQLAIGRIYYGAAVMQHYLRTLTENVTSQALIEPHLYQAFSLRGFWLLLTPPHIALVLYIVSFLGVVFIAIQSWRSPVPLAIRYSTLLLATILAAPHCNIYDLIILALAFLLICDWVLQQDLEEYASVKVLLYSCYLLFLLSPLTRVIHIQLGVVALSILFLILWKTTKQGHSTLKEARLSTHSAM